MMSAILQQQQHLIRRLVPPLPRWGDPWQNWSAVEMAWAIGRTASYEAILRNWPIIFLELAHRGLDAPTSQAGVIATIAIETASSFEPVREAYYVENAEAYRRTLRYYPYYGRGFIQLTWDYNYAHYGQVVDVDLSREPDRAMEPPLAAAILAQYWLEHDIATAAADRNWREVRRRVQGGTDGLDRLTAIVNRLLGYS